ncbi:hypothetical protein JOQ06_022147, partial [Pogonophryne albipinna]
MLTPTLARSVRRGITDANTNVSEECSEMKARLCPRKRQREVSVNANLLLVRARRGFSKQFIKTPSQALSR